MSKPIALPRPALQAAGAADADGRPGVLDFYRVLLASVTGVGRRYRLGLVAEVALIGSYFVLRTAQAGDAVMAAWLMVAGVLAVLSPTSGLVVLAAIAPFSDGLLITRDVGSKTALAGVLMVAVGLRWALDPAARSRPSIPVVLAIALLVGSGLGLIQTRLRWGADFAWLAGQTWLQGVATMLIVFVVAVWVARRGELRPLLVVLGATTAAGLLSLVDFAAPTAIRDSPLGWLVAGPYNATRLTGVIRSPTSTAALVMLPASFYLAALVLAKNPRIQLPAVVLAAPLLLAAYLTYNRAVFLAIYALAVLVGWRIRRWLGIGLLVGGLIVGIVALPPYLAARAEAVGSAQPPPGQLLIASDQQRLAAWGAAARMFLDRPLSGQGYRAYRQLSQQFGDPTLNAPHNEWLRLFAEQGIVIGIIGLAFAATVIARLVRSPGWLTTAIAASFMSVCLAATFNNVFLFNQVMIPAFILAGTGMAIGRAPAVDPADG